MDFQFPHETYDHHCRYNELSIARTGPDGRLYMAGMYSRDFFALDTGTGKIETSVIICRLRATVRMDDIWPSARMSGSERS